MHMKKGYMCVEIKSFGHTR